MDTEEITVTFTDNEDTVTVSFNELARGPAGPAGEGGGASAFADLTDKTTAEIPTINTPLANALAAKAPKASPTFTGTATISSGANLDVVGSIDFGDATVVGMTSTAKTEWRNAIGIGTSDAPTFLGTNITGTASGLTAGSVSAIDGQTATVTRIPIIYTNTTDFTTTSTSFVNVTGLSFPVLANKKYQIIFGLLSNKTDVNGLQIQFTGPASPLKFFNRFFGSTTSISVNASPDIHTAFSVSSTTFNTANGDGYIQSANMGILSNGSNAGTVQLQLRAVTGGTAKIYAGSWIQVTQLD